MSSRAGTAIDLRRRSNQRSQFLRKRFRTLAPEHPSGSRLAAHTGRPVEDLSFFAPRAPIKPVAIAAVLAAEAALDDA